jgi:hypothetical protein
VSLERGDPLLERRELKRQYLFSQPVQALLEADEEDDLGPPLVGQVSLVGPKISKEILLLSGGVWRLRRRGHAVKSAS